MARVAVTDLARCDGRLRLAGRLLGIQWERLGWRLTGVWSIVTELCETVLDRDLVATTLGIRPAKVEGLVRVGLADTVEGEADLVELAPLQALFGRPEWLAELREHASEGGQARVATATRDQAGRLLARDYQREILTALADAPAKSARELAKRLRARKHGISAALSAMVTQGLVVRLDTGHWVLTGSADGSADPSDPGPGPTPDPGPDAAGPSALAPALALAPAPEGVRARQRVGPGPSPGPTQAPDPEPTGPDPGPTGPTADTLADTGRLGWKLANLHDQLGQGVAQAHGLRWRGRGLAGPGEFAAELKKLAQRTREAPNAVSEAEVLQRAYDDVRHVLESLSWEAEELAHLGDPDPLRWLRRPLSEQIWSHAVGLADRETAKEQARRSLQKQPERRRVRDPVQEELDRRRAQGELL